MNIKIRKLIDLILKSDNIVFFGGAGVSTKSGIPDFRSNNGLYNKPYKYDPKLILSHDFFVENPEEFYKFYKSNICFSGCKPNITHYTLAKLEQLSKLKCIITQNVDGLHQKAGSKNVIELHGSIFKNYCTVCKKSYTLEQVQETHDIPTCDCGGIIRPHIVLYDESLSYSSKYKAITAIENCDLLIVGGTSLTVNPASSFLNYFKGENLVIINKEYTSFDSKANLVIHSSLETVFSKINQIL